MASLMACCSASSASARACGFLAVRSYSAAIAADLRISSARTARSIHDDSVLPSAAAACRAWDSTVSSIVRVVLVFTRKII